MADETMCYAARYPGKPGYGSIMVDLPEYAKDTAKDIARIVRAGGTIERVTIEQAKAGMKEYLDGRNLPNRQRNSDATETE